jgi:hypothetical protein
MWSRRVRTVRKLLLVCATGSLMLLAGCNNSSQSDDYTAPGAVPPPSAPPSAPAPPTPAVPPAKGRPMTAWEKQYRNECQSGRVKNGCVLYNDNALRLQGIDPDS